MLVMSHSFHLQISWDVSLHIWSLQVFFGCLGCLFILFLSLIHFCICSLLLGAVFSSLGVWFLLSSRSLQISTSSFDTSSVSFAAAVSPASSTSFSFSCMSLLTCNSRTCLFIRMCASRVMLFTHDVIWLLVHRAEFRMFFTCPSCCLHAVIQHEFLWTYLQLLLLPFLHSHFRSQFRSALHSHSWCDASC